MNYVWEGHLIALCTNPAGLRGLFLLKSVLLYLKGEQIHQYVNHWLENPSYVQEITSH